MSTNKAPQQKKAPVIQINQEVLHNNLSDYVRKNLEDVLNELPDAEADRLCHAKRYERNAERASTRAGSYKRNFDTTSGKVTLNIPKLRNLPFETAIIERDNVQNFLHIFLGSPGQVLLCLKSGHHGRLSRTRGPDVYPGFW